ncbi:ATP-binding protein [Pelosinus propionicus]|uniref:Mg-protoporphyrin IX chelatase n=1 Tax=Pelosinus propionicus DSM 13327 TaxID=1123291 RepID=A0A1I4KTF9_9FIRM|nr:ATP-binding protein [Pelosinus propionicus]SFL81829.1 magnesium chelatase subunit I [Pelosinus propionicus DSM 13327]
MKPYYELVRHTGNQDLFRALDLSIAALHNEIPLHIHAEGLRGTGKTTIMRAVRNVLPPIIRVKGCKYNCHPNAPHCPEHRCLPLEEVKNIGTEIVPCPFLEISHAAKVGTIVGSIDLGKLTNPQEASAAILPGTIPQAHRGIIFIDEINRLADTSPELADILLDVMGTKPGHLQIEEAGMPIIELPVSVSIWAASNPDEEPGALNRIRRQLSDRFDLSINMGRPNNYLSVYSMLEKNNKKETLIVDGQSIAPIGSLDQIVVEERIRKIIAKVYVDFKLESLRAVETMEFAASLSCLLAGRKTVEIADISSILTLALAHRIDGETIAAILKYLDDIKNGCLNPQCLTTYCTSEKELDHPVKEQVDKQVTWWRFLINMLCSKIRFPIKSKQRAGYAGTENGALSGSNIIDPTKATIIAPPNKGLALKELPVEEFIISEGNLNNDKP